MRESEFGPDKLDGHSFVVKFASFLRSIPKYNWFTSLIPSATVGKASQDERSEHAR